MTQKIKVENWSDSILVWVLAISIAVVLFEGDPDVADAIRKKALDWAGLEAVTPE